MDYEIRLITIAEHADICAQAAVASGENHPNPHPAGSTDAREWDRKYQVALLLHSATAIA